MTTRRRFAAGALACAIASALGVRAQPPTKLPLVALVANTVPLGEWQAPRMRDGSPHVGEVIRAGLRERGWIDGKTVRIVHRSAEGKLDRLPAIFEEVAAMPVDVIIAIGPGVTAAARATRSIPIVMSATAAAVDIGLARSLGRPGGNLTGLSFEARDEIIAKRLELLKAAVPGVTRVAFLRDGDPGARWQRMFEAASGNAGVTPVWVSFSGVDDIERAVFRATREGAGAVLVTDGVWVHRTHVQVAINAAAARHRLPVMHSAEGGAETGGLMSYAIDSLGQYRRIPYFVDRILRGAKPSELPMEQPGNPELVINLAVARKLGLGLPPSLLVQATRVIE